MKKNLISAVAAGLALALAITSFGCESGNDTPVHLRYTRENYGYDPKVAAENEDVFTYVAKPTNVYFNLAKVKNDGTVGTTFAFPSDAEDKYTGYTLGTQAGNTYVNGVQAYNVSKGTFDIEGKDPDYTLEAGKNVNTWTETISFDPATGTFEYYDEFTTFKVTELVFCTDTEWDGASGDTGVEGKAGKERIVKNNTIATLDDFVDAVRGTPNEPFAKALRDGAKYKVEKTDTYKGVQIFDTTQYVNADGDVLYEVSTVFDPTAVGFHYVPNATGTFEITGNFKDGTILITGWDDGNTMKVFNDEKGTYVELESNPLTPTIVKYQDFTDGKDIAKEFPETTTSTPADGYVGVASEFCKKGRTLSIASGTITGNKFKTVTSDDPDDYEYTSLLLFQDPKFIYNALPKYYDSKNESCKYVLVD